MIDILCLMIVEHDGRKIKNIEYSLYFGLCRYRKAIQYIRGYLYNYGQSYKYAQSKNKMRIKRVCYYQPFSGLLTFKMCRYTKITIYSTINVSAFLYRCKSLSLKLWLDSRFPKIRIFENYTYQNEIVRIWLSEYHVIWKFMTQPIIYYQNPEVTQAKGAKITWLKWRKIIL